MPTTVATVLYGNLFFALKKQILYAKTQGQDTSVVLEDMDIKKHAMCNSSLAVEKKGRIQVCLAVI